MCAQRLERGVVHGVFGVDQQLGQLRHDLRQADRQLARLHVGHRAEQLDRAALLAPLDVAAHRLENERHHLAHAKARQLAHHGARRHRRRRAHLGRRVAKALQHARQRRSDVRLEQAAEVEREALDRKERALARLRRAHVAERARHARHQLEVGQRARAEPAHQTGDAERAAAPLAVVVRAHHLGALVRQRLHRAVVGAHAQRPHQSCQRRRHRALHALRRRAQRVDHGEQRALHALVGRRQVARHAAREHDKRRARAVERGAARRRRIETRLQQLEQRHGVRQRVHVERALHRRQRGVAHRRRRIDKRRAREKIEHHRHVRQQAGLVGQRGNDAARRRHLALPHALPRERQRVARRARRHIHVLVRLGRRRHARKLLEQRAQHRRRVARVARQRVAERGGGGVARRLVLGDEQRREPAMRSGAHRRRQLERRPQVARQLRNRRRGVVAQLPDARREL
jgi:hypothetical protein